MKRSLSVLLAAALICSCSIKEDRMQCPCVLDLTVSGGAEDRVDLHVWKDGIQDVHGITLSGGGSRTLLKVRRGLLDLSAMSGLHGCAVEGRAIRIPYGAEMDELYATVKSVDSRREEVRDSLFLHKQFVRLHLSLRTDPGTEYPYRMVVKGNVCGLDMVDLSPMKGPFMVALNPVFASYCRLCLPRQMDDSLTLEIYGNDGGADPLAVLPLGSYMEKAGLDWSEEDLDDVYLEVDYASMEIVLAVKDWNTVEL